MSDYRRAYLFTNKYGNPEWLFEVRRGNEVRGADQGYTEAEWRMTLTPSPWPSAEGKPYIVEYRANFGWGNGGPSMTEWDEESWYDEEDFMTHEWVARHYDVFSHPMVVRDFIQSRPGLYEQMYEKSGEYVPDAR